MKTFSMREKKKRYAGYTLVAPAIILLIITFLGADGVFPDDQSFFF